MGKNSIVHFELPVDDVARASSFYQATFGWQLTDMPELRYTTVTTAKTDANGQPTEPGAINGGMMKRSDQLSAPIVTIQVDDIEKALKTVEKNGGKRVQGKQAVGDMGFTGYFADSEGNVVGLWQLANGRGG